MIDNECVIAIGYTQILEKEGAGSREDAILFLRLRCIWNILTFLHEWRMAQGRQTYDLSGEEKAIHAATGLRKVVLIK